MKKNMQWPFIALLICLTTFWGNVQALETATTGQPKTGVGYLEDISFERTAGKERVALVVSQQPVVNTESQGGNAVVLKMDNMFIPDDLRSPRGEGALANVVRVLPVQKTVSGRQTAVVVIELKESVPYSVRQEGQAVIVEFNVVSLAGRAPATGAASGGMKTQAAAPQPIVGGSGSFRGGGEGEAAKYTGRPITVDFQDANIKSVLRLLAEEGGVNIVSGDDVKGTVTVQMKNTPWDQILDTILGIQGLGKKKDGAIITIMTLDKLEKQKTQETVVQQVEPMLTRVIGINYTDAKALRDNLQELLTKDKDGKARGSIRVDEHSNSLIVQAGREDLTRILPIIEKIDKPTSQVQIKANIVETTKDTARQLGIQWGGLWNSGNFFVTPGGTGDTANPGKYTPIAGPGIGLQGFGVNFPATMTATASGSLGLMYGTIGGNILEVQLNALQKDGKLNILSSPSITTLDNQKAFTENGAKVPYVTTETSGGALVKTVKFENVVLRLEITPHIIDGKNMKMKILVQKDEVDSTRSVEGNPFIIKKQTETNLIVQDGETIVISGLSKQTKQDSVSGIPGLKDIPVLGWLFKGDSKSDSLEEVLIFITPKILKAEMMAGILEGPPDQ